jgi:hypothetical protein
MVSKLNSKKNMWFRQMTSFSLRNSTTLPWSSDRLQETWSTVPSTLWWSSRRAGELESYAEHQNKVPEPLSNLSGGLMTATLRKYMADSTANMMNFFEINLFRAPLPDKLWNIVAQKDQTDMIIKKMYRIATTSQRESKDSKIVAISMNIKVEP